MSASVPFVLSIANALTAPVGFASNSLTSFTAKSSRRFGSSARKDGLDEAAANPSGASVMFCETSGFSACSLNT